MTLCRRCAALKSVVRKRPFWFFIGRAGSFSEKKKVSGRSIFFSEKNIMDRLNEIVRSVLSLGNMSNVLHKNKKTGLCREKKNNQAQNIFLPRINIKWSLP